MKTMMILSVHVVLILAAYITTAASNSANLTIGTGNKKHPPCYYNDAVFWPVDTVHLIPEKCIHLTCEWKEFPHTTHIVTYEKKGCNCCVHNGKLVADGTEIAVGHCHKKVCCNGQWLWKFVHYILENGGSNRFQQCVNMPIPTE